MRFTLVGQGGRVASLLRAVIALTLWLPVPIGLLAVAWYGAFVPTVPTPDAIALSVGEIPSTIRSARGLQVGGLERGARAWTPFAEMSPNLVRAIVASEDARFFVHAGFDLEAIGRAAAANRSAGGVQQGGSTITQQLAKSFVGDEETLARKLEELVVARRIETQWSKAEIFEAYANRIYFGAGATGVAAASAIYFGVTPSELTLAQGAMLAAILPAPGRFNPFRVPDLVRERRDRVLDRLAATGLATADEVAEARATPIVLRGVDAVRVEALNIERTTWRALEQLSAGDWRRSGLAIALDIDLVRQRVAERAMRLHLESLDQRQGWRGPLARVTPGQAEAFDRAWTEAAFVGEVQPARVAEVHADAIVVQQGDHRRRLGPTAWRWAAPWRADADNHDATLDDAREAFAMGDIVLLRGEQVTQWPRVEGAYASADLQTGHLEALIGGYDAARSEFDRAHQGCRQPGSTFKPIVYAAALDADYTPSSALRDAPIRIELGPYEEWRPRNADGSFEGHLTLWEALIWSRNLPALQVYRELGSARTIRYARALGVRSELDAVESLALGASCLAPMELLEVYTAFARTGYGMAPRLVERVTAPDGRDVVSSSSFGGARVGTTRMAARWWRDAGRAPAPRLAEGTGFQMAWLLEQVVERGTGRELAELPTPYAGKTGTTNAFDAWFAGFSGREVAVTWIGSDRNDRPLGERETGGELALPAWRDATLPAVYPSPLLADAPATVEWVDVEPSSGWRAAEDRWSIAMPFRVGTAPRREADTQAARQIRRIDRIERGDAPL